MKYEEVGSAATKHLCSKYQDLTRKCPGCSVAKECWAGYHIEAGRMTTEDFRVWLDSHNTALADAVASALVNMPT